MQSVSFQCLACDVDVVVRSSRKSRRFCSHKCQKQHLYLTEVKPDIELGLRSERSTLKRYLTRERGFKCELCSISEWHGHLLSLELDHINGDASSNLPTNIRLLCPNCHSTTPTWKNRNKGKGRKARGLPLH